ncbi:MAG: hypothetical protein WD042_08180 [Phycisphaeraceae bacterium]
MRLIIDTLIAMMLIGALAGLLWHRRAQDRRLEDVQTVHGSLAKLQEQATYHGAIDEMPVSRARFPLALSPLWFEGPLPENVLAPGRLPWIDVAPPDDMSDHPPDPLVTGPTQAGFWYNPNRGIFRARVTPQFTDRETRELYNTLNNSRLNNLMRDPRLERQPMPMDWLLALTDAELEPDAPPGVKPATLITSPAPLPAKPTLRSR